MTMKAEAEIMSKSKKYLAKSEALRVMIDESKSTDSSVALGESHYEFVFGEISSSLAKHIKVFGEVVTIKVNATYNIVVTVRINE